MAIIYKTGRSRTVVLTGGFSGLRNTTQGREPLYGPTGNCIPGTGAAPTSADSSGAISAPWGYPNPASVSWAAVPAGVGGTTQDGFRISLDNGFGATSVIDLLTDMRPGGHGLINWTIALSGTYSMTVEVEEFVSIGAPDSSLLNADGFPQYEAMGYDDGLMANRIVIYEAIKNGTNSVVSVTANGSGGTATGPAPAGFVIGYSGAGSLYARGGNLNGYSTLSAALNGQNVPWPAYSRSVVSTYSNPTCSISSGYAEVRANNTTGTDGCAPYGVCDGQIGSVSASLPRQFSLGCTCRRIDGSGYPSPLIARYIDKASGGYEHVAELTCNPDGSVSWSQSQYSVSGVVLLGNSQTGVSLDEFADVRAWLKGSSLLANAEDVRDWRLQFQLWPWQSLNISHDASVTVAPAHAFTLTSPSVATTVGNWEGYRYLRVDYPAGLDGRSFVLTPNEPYATKTFPFKIVGNSAGALLIDLCDNATIPTGLEIDDRATRYPLNHQTGGYSPTAGVPDQETPADQEKGVKFGILGRVTAISLSGILSGESLAFGPFELVRTASRVSVLRPFLHDFLGWTSPTDNTFLECPVWLYADNSQRCAWADRAHILPTEGSFPSFVYWDHTYLKTQIENSPGWHATLQSPPSYSPVLASDGTTKLMDAGLPAAHLESLVWATVGGVDQWVDQTDLSCPCSIWTPFLADQVEAYPGCGDPRKAYGPTNTVFPLNASKVLRGLAEGQVFAPNGPFSGVVVAASDVASPTISYGSGTSGTDGSYRTGTPFGPGYRNIRTKANMGDNPYVDDVWADRWRKRVTFLVPRPAISPGIWLWEDPRNGCNLASLTADHNVRVRRAPWYAPFGGWLYDVVLTTSSDCQDPFVVGDPVFYRLYANYVRSGTVYERFSDDDGATWSAETSIAMGYQPRYDFDKRGNAIRCRLVFDSGTSGPATITGEFRAKGHTSWQTSHIFKDETGANMKVADQGWGCLRASIDAHSPWVLIFIPDGETSEASYMCCDEHTLTWKRLT